MMYSILENTQKSISGDSESKQSILRIRIKLFLFLYISKIENKDNFIKITLDKTNKPPILGTNNS